MHASLARAAMVAALFSAASLHGWARQADSKDKDKKDTLDPGIYMKFTGSDSLVRIHAQNAADQKTKGMTKTFLTGGLSQPTHEIRVNGARSDARITGDHAEFYIVLDTGKNKPDPGADPMAALASMGMGGDALPPQAKSGNDFMLIRLKATESERIADLGKVASTTPKDPVACAVDHMPDGSYRFTPKQALGVGEYAFIYVAQMGMSGQLWTFGVDPAK